MKIIYEHWWAGGNKVFQVTNYRESWIKEGNKPRLLLHSNGAKKSRGDTCYDISLIVGYTIFNYTNFDLQGTVTS